MAGNMKPLDPATDIVPVSTILREAIPITGSIISGTYAESDGTGNNSNIKTYTHGLFLTAYDYPYASSSANDLFDITAGYSTNSTVEGATGAVSGTQKNNIYNQMSQVLVGYDQSGSIERFDKDGDLRSGPKVDEIIVMNISRLLAKDGIDKGTFSLDLGVSGGFSGPFTHQVRIKDTTGTSSYLVNSPKGEYGILYASNLAGIPLDGLGTTAGATDAPCGLLYYQPGIAVLSASMFNQTASGGLMSASNIAWHSASATGERTIHQTLASGTIDDLANGLRHRFSNLSFNNTTMLNSTMYTCRITSRDFNYSSNPTYLSGSKIIVKGNNPKNNPKTFITTVGLYGPLGNQLLAVAKLAKPIENSNFEDLLIKVRLDY